MIANNSKMLKDGVSRNLLGTKTGITIVKTRSSQIRGTLRELEGAKKRIYNFAYGILSVSDLQRIGRGILTR